LKQNEEEIQQVAREIQNEYAKNCKEEQRIARNSFRKEENGYQSDNSSDTM
jgi:hypothetical protein